MPSTQIDVGIVLKAVDKATTEIAAVGKSVSGLGSTAGQAAGDFKGAADGMVDSSRDAGKAFDNLRQSALDEGKAIREANKEHQLANIDTRLLVDGLREVGSKFSDVGRSCKGSVDIMAKGLGAVQDKLNDLMPGFTGAFGSAMLLFGSFANIISVTKNMMFVMGTLKLAMAGGALATAAHTAANWFHAASQWAVNAAMYACPLVWIVIAIAAIVAAIYLLITNWDKVTKAFGDFGKWAGKGLGDAWNGITKWCGDVSKAMGDAWEGVKNGAQGANDWIKNIFEGTAKKAYEWGQALIKAFNDGMQAAKKWLEDGCKSIGDTIGKFFKGASPPKEGPLSEVDKWGMNFGKTYSRGILSSIPDIESTLRSIRTSSVSNSNIDNRNISNAVEFHISGVNEDRIVDKLLERLSEALG
jgi:hypothetical protein